MLSRQNNRINGDGFAVFVAQCDLTFRVWTQPRQNTVFAQTRLAFHQPMGVINGRRHQHRRFVAGVAKHQTLVASTDIFVLALVDALGNIAGLLAYRIKYRAGITIETHVRAVVTDVRNHIADNLLKIDIGIGAHFTGNNRHACFNQRLHGDTGVRIICKNGI